MDSVPPGFRRHGSGGGGEPVRLLDQGDLHVFPPAPQLSGIPVLSAGRVYPRAEAGTGVVNAFISPSPVLVSMPVTALLIDTSVELKIPLICIKDATSALLASA